MNLLWLWILGGLVLLFLLFCMVRLGLLLSVGDGGVRAWLTVGPLRIQVAPAREKAEKKAGKKPKKQIAPQKLEEKLKTMSKPTRDELRTAWQALWPPARRALERTRRGVRIDPMQLSVTLGGKRDPAWTAELYGLLNAAVWTAMPVLEQLVNIPRPGIHIGTDFDRERAEVSGCVGVSMRIGTMLALGVGTGVPALRWFMRYQKGRKAAAPSSHVPAAPAA